MFTNPDFLASRVAQHVGELHADAAAARQLRAARARTTGAALTSTHSERGGRLRRLFGAAAASDATVLPRVARGVPGRAALPTR